MDIKDINKKLGILFWRLRTLDVKDINKKLRIFSVVSLVIFVIYILYNTSPLISTHTLLPISVAVIVVSFGLWKTRNNNQAKPR